MSESEKNRDAVWAWEELRAHARDCQAIPSDGASGPLMGAALLLAIGQAMIWVPRYFFGPIDQNFSPGAPGDISELAETVSQMLAPLSSLTGSIICMMAVGLAVARLPQLVRWVRPEAPLSTPSQADPEVLQLALGRVADCKTLDSERQALLKRVKDILHREHVCPKWVDETIRMVNAIIDLDGEQHEEVGLLDGLEQRYRDDRIDRTQTHF